MNQGEKGGRMEGIHLKPEEEVVPKRWTGNDLLPPPPPHVGALGNNLPPRTIFENKRGDLDYKMESVNKRHFQGDNL